MKTKPDRMVSPDLAQRGAAAWSFLYMLFGGGIIGAIAIFVVLKFLGQ
jgi:hypothetical protein